MLFKHINTTHYVYSVHVVSTLWLQPTKVWTATSQLGKRDLPRRTWMHSVFSPFIIRKTDLTCKPHFKHTRMSCDAAGSPSIMVLSFRHSEHISHTLDWTDFFTELRSTALLTCWQVNPDLKTTQNKLVIKTMCSIDCKINPLLWIFLSYGYSAIPTNINPSVLI